jgi:hypothetical protein
MEINGIVRYKQINPKVRSHPDGSCFECHLEPGQGACVSDVTNLNFILKHMDPLKLKHICPRILEF